MPTKTLPSQSAVQLLLATKHPEMSTCLLILRRFGEFDPYIMDASSQGKAPGIIRAYESLCAGLEAEGRLDDAKEMAAAWVKDRTSDLHFTEIRTERDVNEYYTSSLPFKRLMLLSKQIMGDKLSKYISLCYSNTISVKRISEETGSNFMWLDIDPYRCLPEGTDAGAPSPINYKYGIRADLAELSTNFVIRNSRFVASPEYRRAVVGATPSAWYDLADQVAEALRFTHSLISKPGERDIFVQNLFVQTFSTLLHLHRTGKGFTALIRRIAMQRVTGDGSDHTEEGEAEELGEFTYRLTDARMLRWIPGKDSFVPATEVSAQDAGKPAFHIEACSYYEEGSGRRNGLDTDDDAAYFATLAREDTDIAWLLTQIMVARPPYPRGTKDNGGKDLRIFDQVSQPQTVCVNSNYLRCEGFVLRRLDEMESALNLANIRRLALEHATAYGLGNGVEFTRNSEAHVTERRRTPVLLMVKHFRTLSYEEGRMQCRDLLDLHRAHSELRLGGYIAKVGDQGLSCKSREIARKIQNLQNPTVAVELFKAEHPGHDVFIRPPSCIV